MLLMEDLRVLVTYLAQAQASIAILDVFRRSDMRGFRRAFLNRPDRRLRPRPRDLLPRRRTLLLRRYINVHDATGLDGDEFNELMARIGDRVAAPRRREGRQGVRTTAAGLLTEDRLFLALTFLRNNSFYHELAREYQVSRAFISRDIRHIIPTICAALHNEIAFPANAPPLDLIMNVHGMIDCTVHWRQEVSPDGVGQDYSLFRTDIGMPNIGALVVTSLEGVPWHVTFFSGHNNDQGVYNITGMDRELQQRGLFILSDSGFNGTRMVRPDDDWRQDSGDPFFAAKHRALRATIERMFWFVESWSVAGQTCRLPLLTHVYCLDAIWKLATMLLKRNPMIAIPDAEVME